MHNEILKSFRQQIEPEIFEKSDGINLKLTKQAFMEKMLQEKDGWPLLDLLEKGEWRVAENHGLIQGYRENSEIYFEIPSWNHLLAHLRIVNSV
jgi:hypothetical protein